VTVFSVVLRDPSGRRVRYACGHRHRSVETASQCLESQPVPGGVIEAWDGEDLVSTGDPSQIVQPDWEPPGGDR
jgi:hypothetical protein